MSVFRINSNTCFTLSTHNDGVQGHIWANVYVYIQLPKYLRCPMEQSFTNNVIIPTLADP